MKVNALELFFKQKRFDLIFKYLYIKNRHKLPSFYEQLYLEHIRAFNGFYEVEPSDGQEKSTPEAFIRAFDRLYDNIKREGYDANKGSIPIGDNGEISDGAHRLTIAAVLGKDVEIENDGRSDLYDYKYFLKRNIYRPFADFAAFEYVKLNPKAYIVNLHAVSPIENDPKVEEILNKYGSIYYKKNVYLTTNGYVNLKKISYGSFWENEPWIGNAHNGFAGARMHANNSMDPSKKAPLRAYVFICDNIENVLKAKAEIRSLENKGNFSIHINDTRDEAVCLASIYFNDNSIEMLNARSYKIETEKLDTLIHRLKEEVRAQEADIDDVCGAGSTPLNVAGARESADLDFLYSGSKPLIIPDGELSHHASELKYYPHDEATIVHHPQMHFYYNGVKFISLDILLKMKRKRNERPKDVKDCKLISKIKKGAKNRFKLFEKVKQGNKKSIVLFGKITIVYKTVK